MNLARCLETRNMAGLFLIHWPLFVVISGVGVLPAGVLEQKDLLAREFFTVLEITGLKDDKFIGFTYIVLDMKDNASANKWGYKYLKKLRLNQFYSNTKILKFENLN